MKPESETDRGPQVNLAFMECFASCVMTALRLDGKDDRKLLLDYWNVAYRYRTLLSSKDARELPLRFIYGIDLRFVRGSAESLIDAVRGGASVILLCKASKLAYFPRSFLSMETGGFQHSVLLHGWNDATGRLRLADPIIGHAGEIDPREAEAAGRVAARLGELHYFVMTAAPASYEEPDSAACAAYGARSNLASYRNEELAADPDRPVRSEWADALGLRTAGIRALDQFAADAANSADWTADKRDGWIARNNLTISSIKRLRQRVWEAFLRSYPFGPEDRAEGQRSVDRIVTSWTALSLQLLKHNGAANVAIRIRERTDRVRDDELAFLQWLHDKVKLG